jgi:hypothetical protein
MYFQTVGINLPRWIPSALNYVQVARIGFVTPDHTGCIAGHNCCYHKGRFTVNRMDCFHRDRFIVGHKGCYRRGHFRTVDSTSHNPDFKELCFISFEHSVF